MSGSSKFINKRSCNTQPCTRCQTGLSGLMRNLQAAQALRARSTSRFGTGRQLCEFFTSGSLLQSLKPGAAMLRRRTLLEHRQHRSASREGSAPKSKREPARRRAPTSQPARSEKTQAERLATPPPNPQVADRPAPTPSGRPRHRARRRAVSCLDAARNHTPSYQHIHETGMARCRPLRACRLKNN